MTFAGVRVLTDVDLAVSPGEFVSLVGPSGCGKTTVLNLIAGFFRPSCGTVKIQGRPVLGPGADRAMVFQADAVFPWATVLDNVAYGLRLRRVPRARRRERALELVERVGLAESRNAYPHQLSGGMRKRVDVARALAVQPEVLLMDEPFAALDAITKEQLQDLLLELHAQYGPTIMFVTHDIEEALLMSDRVVLMGSGNRCLTPLVVPLGRPRAPGLRTDPRLQGLRADLATALRDGRPEAGSASQVIVR